MLEILFGDFWPFWLGAFGLSSTAFGFCFFMKTPLGVSGFFRRVLFFRSNLKKEKMERAMFAKQAAVKAALERATAEHMAGLSEEEREMLASRQCSTDKRSGPKPVQVSLSASAIYLVFIVIGGFLGESLSQTWSLSFQPDQAFQRLVAGSGWSIVALVLGGILVGFGTSMAGGCTSGHGLSGTARLQAGSLVSTASFFGTAILVAILLRSLA